MPWMHYVTNAVFRFKITSGYRSKTHSLEVKKPGGPGKHTAGIAADIAVSNGAHRFIIVANAIKLGFSGVGIARSFVHCDIRETTPVIWTYQ